MDDRILAHRMQKERKETLYGGCELIYRKHIEYELYQHNLSHHNVILNGLCSLHSLITLVC